MILLGILVEVIIILAIDYTPWGNAIFGCRPISIEAWHIMVPCGLAFLLVEEVRKLFFRAWLWT